MRFYHFKGGDKFEFDCHIFALTAERACELFVVQLILNGENPDQMMWRELGENDLAEPDRTHIGETLALQIEGIAKHEPRRGWWPVAPFDLRTSGGM